MKFVDSLRVMRVMLLAFIMSAPAMLFAQDPSQMQLPADEAVRVGHLPNGLTYYIRHNEKPKGQADFYIAQRVGAIQEEDDQRGLAHFLEHMCFNGTTNFPGNSLISWLETVGVKFGQNLNAYTAVDETVYNISNVPIAREGVQDSCLLILHDWANELLLEGPEIDKERGVIHQEWRSRNVGSQRIFTDILPKIYPTSKYGQRMPIGTMEVVDNFPYEALRNYYEAWYRPDLQAIVVVGDIDVDRIENKIKEMFSDIPAAAADAPERVYYPVPDHQGVIYGIGKDPEQRSNAVELCWLSDALPDAYRNTPVYLQLQYMNRIIAMMLNNRFNDITSKPNAPFAYAVADFDGFFLSSRTKDAFMVYAVANEPNVYPAYEAAYREVLRAARGGFTISEYERAKADYLASAEQAYNNRESRENEQFVNTYVRNFLDATPMIDIEMDWQVDQQLAMMIPLEVLNEYFADNITDDNRVVIALLADKPGLVYPDDAGFDQITASVNAENIEAYQDVTREDPLITDLRPAGQIVEETTDEAWGTTTWTLSNGIKVVIKPTTFRADQIIFNAAAVDGMAGFRNNYINERIFGEYAFDNYSLGAYNNLDLQRYLAGKQVGMTFSFSDYTRDINASTTPKDLETMLELVYMAFTNVSYDPTEFDALKAQMAGILNNQEGTPQYIFNQTLLTTLYPQSPTARMITSANITGSTAENTTTVVRALLANPIDYTMYFVGNVDMETLRPLVEKYLASLPTNPSMAVRSVVEYDSAYFPTVTPQNVTTTAEMQTPQTYVAIYEVGDMPYTIKNQKLAQIAGQIMTNRLLHTVREDWGAVYSIGASGNLNRMGMPNATLRTIFPMKPEEKDRVLEFIANEFRAMETNVTAEELAPIVEFMVKNNREGQEDNGTWLSAICGLQYNGVDTFLGAIDCLNALTPQDVMDYMKALNAQGGYKVIVLEPAQ